MSLNIYDDGFWNFRMLGSHHSNKSRRPACLSMLVTARCLLMLLVWSGPVPVCHSHGTLANTSNIDNAFEQHLRTYHRDVDLCRDVQLGLHFHWVLQVDSQGGTSNASLFLACSQSMVANGNCQSCFHDWLGSARFGGTLCCFQPCVWNDARLECWHRPTRDCQHLFSQPSRLDILRC